MFESSMHYLGKLTPDFLVFQKIDENKTEKRKKQKDPSAKAPYPFLTYLHYPTTPLLEFYIHLSL